MRNQLASGASGRFEALFAVLAVVAIVVNSRVALRRTFVFSPAAP